MIWRRRRAALWNHVALLTVTLAAASLFYSCSSSNPTEPNEKTVAAYDADVANEWFDLQLQLIQTTPGFTPPVSSRALGYSGIALYHALLPGMQTYRSLEGQLNGFAVGTIPSADDNLEYHWPSVANACMARILNHLYANTPADQKQAIADLEESFVNLYLADVEGEIVNRSVAYGQSVADAVFEYSKTDNGHEGYASNFPSSYEPPTGPGLWVPTPRRGGDPQPALQPYWGDNRPFVLTPGDPNDQAEPGPPPAYSEDTGSTFYKEAFEVYEACRNATEEQTTIAKFWSDDPGSTPTPPGHSVSILRQCIDAESKNLEFAVVGYAQVGIAVADAFIACWESKYRYNLVRPITYIPDVIDPTFSYEELAVNTPPFPEYTSGHSVQSGASFEVLTELFGEHFSFVDHTHDSRGMAARTYDSFYDAADEAALSRLYGGIHYRAAIELGVDQGKIVGRQVLDDIAWTD